MLLLSSCRCCGDQYHFDMSSQAFSKIADNGAGVVGTYYRQVGVLLGQYEQKLALLAEATMCAGGALRLTACVLVRHQHWASSCTLCMFTPCCVHR